jgi:hypothetical protein
MRLVVFGLAFLILGAAGVYETKRTLSRVTPQAAAAIQAGLDKMPLTFNDWVGEKVPFDMKQLERTKADAHLNVLFRNTKTKDVVSVLVLAGRADEIGAHDPNRCYAGAGFQRVGPAAVKGISGQPSTYWQARFDTDTFPAQSIQVNWSWTTNGTWTASTEARYEFIGQPTLYKLYLSRNLTANDATRTDDPIDQLLVSLLPTLQPCLVAKK